MRPLYELIAAHVLAAERLHGDDTPVPILAKGKTETGRAWVYVRDDRPLAAKRPPRCSMLPATAGPNTSLIHVDGSFEELTRWQRRKPRIGQSGIEPEPFDPVELSAGSRVLMVSDGALQLGSYQSIVGDALQGTPEDCVAKLLARAKSSDCQSAPNLTP